MKFTFDKDKLLETLSLASRFTANKLSSAASLQGVLLKTEGEETSFISTNLNSFFKTKIKTPKNGSLNAVIEPRKILEFLSYLPEGKLEVEIDEKKAVFTKNKTKGTFPLIEARDFPLPPAVSKEKKQKVKGAFLLKNLPLVLFAASPDETRPVLTGVNFVTQDEDLYVVSTDGFRLSLLKTKNNANFKPMLIPREFLEEVLRFVKEDEDVEMRFLEKEKIVFFQIEELEFYTRLIEGDFPPYEKVIPDDHKTKAVVDREELLQNVKIASVFARDFSSIIILEFKGGGLSIHPKTDQEGENTTYQDIEAEGTNQKVAFNFKFLADFLNNVSSDKIIIEVLRPDAPVAFRMPDNKDFLHIIMPVRIQGV